MSHHKSNQKGFGSVESLLIIIIVLLIGFVGYYVWHAQMEANKTLNSASQATQSAVSHAAQQSSSNNGQTVGLSNGLASFVLPTGWAFARPASICSGTTDNVISCLDSAEAAPANVAKAQTGDAFGADIALLKITDGKNAQDWYFKDYLQAIQDSSYTVSPEKTNGLQGVHLIKTTNSYTDESYVLRKDDKVVLIQSRVSATSYTPGGAAVADHQDNTKYVPAIKRLAASVHIR